MKKVFMALLAYSLLIPAFVHGKEQLEFLRPKVKVHKVENLTPDNAIDHPAWKKSAENRFMLFATEPAAINKLPKEHANVKYLYDDKYFYVRAEFFDSDIMTTGTKHGGHFYAQGDVLEVFLKPVNHNYYWEIYGTPNELRTRFHYPSRGTLGLPSGFAPNDLPILVKAKVDGTFNDCSDKDTKWCVVLMIPRSELEKYGYKFDNPSRWLVLSARYNYSRYLDKHEYSSFPQIALSYHLYEYYAEIEFVK